MDCSNTKMYLKEFNRMCKSCKRCIRCPIGCAAEKVHLSSCMDYIKDYIDEAVEIVQKWSNEHQPETDWTKVPVDTPVLVSHYGRNNLVKRYFAAYIPGYKAPFICFGDGATSENASGIIEWHDCKLDPSVDPTPYYKEWFYV